MNLFAFSLIILFRFSLIRLFLLTWNVKDSGPDNGDYSDLLNKAFNSVNGTREPDVIAIGYGSQLIVNLTQSNGAKGSICYNLFMYF